MRIKIMVVTALIFACFAAPLFAAETYVFGVHPYRNPAELATIFKPLISMLEAETGAKISFRSAKDFKSFNQAIVNGEIDIFYTGPKLYAELSVKHSDKVRLLGTFLDKGKPTFKGVIVAKKDSPIKSLADLRDKKFAFGDRDSTLSCYVPAAMLMDAGVFDSLKYDFTGKPDNVANSVLRGQHDAGGLKPDIAVKYMDQGLKVIAESAPLYEHVVGVGSRVDGAAMKKIQDALVNVKDLSVYTSIVKSYTGFAVTKPGDYAGLLTIIEKVDAKIPQ